MSPIEWENRKKNINKLSHKDKVRFALFCARQVEHIWKSVPEAVEAVKVTELWLIGKATSEECSANAADAADAATYAAAYAAANAAYAANAAAYAAVAYTAYAAANAAADAAADAADAVAYTAYAAAYAAVAYTAAADAADAATYADTKIEQMEYLSDLLHLDSIFENVLLGATN